MYKIYHFHVHRAKKLVSRHIIVNGTI